MNTFSGSITVPAFGRSEILTITDTTDTAHAPIGAPGFYPVQVLSTQVVTPTEFIGNSHIATEGAPTIVNAAPPFEGMGDSLFWQSSDGQHPIVEITLNAPGERYEVPDSEKGLWRVVASDGVLSAEVFREGIDKLVAVGKLTADGISGGTGGSTGAPSSLEDAAASAADYLALITPLTDQAKAFSDAQTAAMNEAYLLAVGEIQQPVSPYPGDESAAFHIGPNIELPALGATISTDVFEHLPFIGTFFTIVREVILLWMAFYFVRYCGDHLREWYKLAFMTPQLTTKSAGIAGDQLQVVGVAKQFSIAALFMVAFIAVVAATIAGYNSRLGAIADGVNVANLMTEMRGGFGPSLANSTVSAVSSFVGLFFPWQAAFAFLVARYAIQWLTIPLWSAALFAARLIHF